ncbi:hypothetical protein ABZS66_11505 [Dactylosporangium sp. NPDC005572]|uniref:hypothetical protein n=1 Tax=Dactylosporangium sp. NPDC005572 TaxID=3156889 RepID=UPI0033A1CF28
MPIEVDDAFIDNIANVNFHLAAEAPGAAKGEIDNLIIKSGHANFAPGQNLASVIRADGSTVKQRLGELGALAGTRYQDLKTFLLITDDAESLNDMTVDEFRSTVPSFG